jgi:hypothetical protein
MHYDTLSYTYPSIDTYIHTYMCVMKAVCSQMPCFSRSQIIRDYIRIALNIWLFVVCWTELPITRIIWRRMVGWPANNELKKIQKEAIS